MTWFLESEIQHSAEISLKWDVSPHVNGLKKIKTFFMIKFLGQFEDQFCFHPTSIETLNYFRSQEICLTLDAPIERNILSFQRYI